MTDAIIIQILSRFAARQGCPSLGYTQPYCLLPAWLHADSSMGQVSLQGSWWATGNLTCLHLCILSTCSCPISWAKGEGHPVFKVCSSVGTAAQSLPAHSPACTQMQSCQSGLTSEKTKHAIHHTNTSFPALLLLWNTRFLNPPTALCLHNLSGSTSQTLSTTSNCTCHCPTPHQVLAESPPQGSEPKSPGAAFSPPQDHISSTSKHTHTDIPTMCASIST